MNSNSSSADDPPEDPREPHEVGAMPDVTIPEMTFPEEPVSTVVLRILLAKVQEDGEILDLQLRRLHAGGHEVAFEAFKHVAHDLAITLKGMYRDYPGGAEAKLLEILRHELGLDG